MRIFLAALLACAALPLYAEDNVLLIQQGPEGFVVWHADGATQLTDAQLTDIVMSALPEGGPRLRLNGTYAKGFTGKLGVTTTLWKVSVRN